MEAAAGDKYSIAALDSATAVDSAIDDVMTEPVSSSLSVSIQNVNAPSFP